MKCTCTEIWSVKLSLEEWCIYSCDQDLPGAVRHIFVTEGTMRLWFEFASRNRRQ